MIFYSRLSVPEVIRFNRSEYKDDVGIDEEVQVGPEIMHIYQVYGVKHVRHPWFIMIPGTKFNEQLEVVEPCRLN